MTTESPDDAPARPPVSIVMMLSCWLLFMCAVLVLLAALHHDHLLPVELTAREREGVQRQTTFQTEIRLRIVSREELASTSPVPDLLALSIVNRLPCEILIPEGWTIEFRSETGRARWTDRGQEDVLAHEILHCLRGRWHDDWSVISATKR